MEISEARRLKELERENAELKKVVAEQSPDIRMLKDVLKKMVDLPVRREVAGYLEREYSISQRRACRVLELSMNTARRRQAVIMRY